MLRLVITDLSGESRGLGMKHILSSLVFQYNPSTFTMWFSSLTCLFLAIACTCWLLVAQLLRLKLASDMIFLALLKYWMADSLVGVPDITLSTYRFCCMS